MCGVQGSQPICTVCSVLCSMVCSMPVCQYASHVCTAVHGNSRACEVQVRAVEQGMILRLRKGTGEKPD
eukprot:scaffold272852_cov29-Tisochrysis_lutea.AAC.1